jgi:hypothetical protein
MILSANNLKGQPVSESTPNTPKPASPTSESRAQPTKRLPTERIAFSKQLDILRAYGTASQGGTRAVNYKDVAELVKMSPSTVALMNVWMVDVGLVDRAGNDFMPSRPLIEYAQAYSWSPETAATKLASAFRKTWFGERLSSRLAFRSMTLDEVVADLAGQIAADPSYKPQIETVVDFAVASGIARRDGNMLFQGDIATPQRPEAAAKPITGEANIQLDDVKVEATGRARAVSTGFMASPEGRVQFHVSIDVSMKEMADWQPERISAFFAGLAQVLAAKHGAEKV